MKKLIPLMLAFILVIACPMTIFAAEDGLTPQNYTDFVVYDSPEEAEAAIEEVEVTPRAFLGGAFTPSIYFSRTSSSDKNVNMYFKISNCKDRSNAIKYYKIEICNTNLLNRKVYKTFAKSGPITKNYPALINGHIFIDKFDLATSVKEVRVDWGYVRIHMMDYGWTSSAADPIGKYKIQ